MYEVEVKEKNGEVWRRMEFFNLALTSLQWYRAGITTREEITRNRKENKFPFKGPFFFRPGPHSGGLEVSLCGLA